MIAVSLTGSKGQALRVFTKISTPRYASGSILPKNLDSRRSPGSLKGISFFLLFFFFLFSGGKNYLQGQSLKYSPSNHLAYVYLYFEVLHSERRNQKTSFLYFKQRK